MTFPKLLVALLVLFGGCARTGDTRSELPVTDRQRILTADSASRLRDEFSRNDCVGIYREGAQAFRAQREKDWLNDCAELRTGLGAWRTFAIQSTIHCGVAVCTDGLAAFDKITKSVEVGWALHKDHARVMWFVLVDKEQTDIFPGRPEPFGDPPPVHDPGPA